MNRTVSVVRMQLINKQTYIWVPLLVLGGSFVITLAVYAILAGSGLDGPFYGGGAQAPLWYFAVVGIQALTLTFPFSQAMSVTRREFYLGTVLTAALTSAILAGIAVVGGLVEIATDGWGMNGWFFGLPWIWEKRRGGRVPVQLRRRDALLRGRLLGGHHLQAVRRDLAHHRARRDRRTVRPRIVGRQSPRCVGRRCSSGSQRRGLSACRSGASSAAPCSRGSRSSRSVARCPNARRRPRCGGG